VQVGPVVLPELVRLARPLAARRVVLLALLQVAATTGP
jgi:hypothetical protein